MTRDSALSLARSFQYTSKPAKQDALKQLDRWIEALKQAQLFTFCGLPYGVEMGL